VACIGGGAAIFLGLLTLLVFGDVHKFTNQQGNVLILISIVPAAVAVIGVSWRWMFKGAEPRQRVLVAFPAALIAEAVLCGAAAWLWAQKWS